MARLCLVLVNINFETVLTSSALSSNCLHAMMVISAKDLCYIYTIVIEPPVMLGWMP